MPVYHYGFLDHTKNTLSCVCLKCSKVLLAGEIKEVENILKNKFNKSRNSEIRKIISVIPAYSVISTKPH